MCKAPKLPPQKDPDKPEFLRNRFLDAAFGQFGTINQLRTGRSDLRTDLGTNTLQTVAPIQNPLAPTSGPGSQAPLPRNALAPVGLPGINQQAR